MNFAEYIKKNIASFSLITESTNKIYEFENGGKKYILKHCRENEENISAFWYMMKKLFYYNFAGRIAGLDLLYKNLSNEYIEIAKPVYTDPLLKYHVYSKIDGESYSPDIFPENKNIMEQLGKFIVCEGFNTPPLGAIKKVLNPEANTLPKQHTPLLAAGLLIGFMHQKKYEHYGITGNSDKSNFSNNLIETITSLIKKYHGDDDEMKIKFDGLIKTDLSFDNFAIIMPDISANQFIYSPDFEAINGLVDLDAYVAGPVEMELTVIELCMPNEVGARCFKAGYEQFSKLPGLKDKRSIFRFLIRLCEHENTGEAELIMNKRMYWD